MKNTRRTEPSKNKEAGNLKRPLVVCHLEKYSAAATIRTMAIAANQSISSQRLPLVVLFMCIIHHLRTQFESYRDENCSLEKSLNPRVVQRYCP